MLQLGIISIQVNKLESDPKTDRTNSTTKGKEEAILKKAGSAEKWFGRETVHDCSNREVAMVTEKGMRQINTQGSTGEK